MPRTLTVLFRRDPSRDRQCEQIHFEGYQVCWPDGRPVAVGLDAFCTQGQRLLGLGRHLKGCAERPIELLCFPLCDREADMTKLPGARVRRFLLQRTGREGRIHFLDGTPTATVFDLGADEQRVLGWIGLSALSDGEGQWFDLAARAVEVPSFARLAVTSAP
ncbi:MAG TPA: hypothetical protein VKA46_32880 [Gemmataceae bacterium]|nr:hypothetical protein [Gemmataceae bacterium]